MLEHSGSESSLEAFHPSKLPLEAAEDLAARAQGFRDRDHYWAALADYVINRRLS